TGPPSPCSRLRMTGALEYGVAMACVALPASGCRTYNPLPPMMASAVSIRTTSLLVVGIFLPAMVGDIADAGELGQLLHEGLFHAFLQREIHCAATLATTTEAQYRYAILGQRLQRDVAAMGRQPRIDLVVQDIVDAVLQAAVGTDARHARIRRANGQLATHSVAGKSDHGRAEVGLALLVDEGTETFVVVRFVVRFLFTGAAEGNAGFGLRRASVQYEDPDADTLAILLLQQLAQIGLAGLSDLDHDCWNSSRLGCGP